MKHVRSLRNSGFTLLEILVAIVAGGLVVQVAHRVVVALADARASIRREAAAFDAHANAENLLRSLVRQMRATSAVDSILGNENEVRFTSHCESASGWIERCQVTLRLNVTNAHVLVQSTHTPTFDVELRSITGSMLYLDQSGDTREWKSQPSDRVAALGIVRQRDTLLLPVAVRQ